ncbi:MAG: hypothetical protein AB1480_15285 [Nitrospirota bacterium]
MPFTDILSRQEDLGKTKFYHEILTKGSDFETCKKRVLHFFQNYQLVRYSNIVIIEEDSLTASSLGFRDRLQKAILKNNQILHDLIKELQDENITTLDDLKKLPQGYKSKMLHVITHFGCWSDITYHIRENEIAENNSKTFPSDYLKSML